MRSWLNVRALVPATELAEIYAHERIDGHGWLYPDAVLDHWSSVEASIPIPPALIDAYAHLGRPTPVVRAYGLERQLETSWRIYLKREDLMPNGSFKICSALPQAYYGSREGRRRIVVETGAGQTGAAAALAGSYFGLETVVFMVRSSYEAKELRRRLMELYGATVYPSPSERTAVGRRHLDLGHTSGSIAIATSEIFEVLRAEGGMNIAGSLLDFTLSYNTLLGLEAWDQLSSLGARADVVIGCVGGGSSFGGFALPFAYRDEAVELIAVESQAIPTLTQGRYGFDHPDGEGEAPPLKMYSLGYDFMPPAMHASGLRYHAASPIVSYLVRIGRVKACACAEADALAAGRLLAHTDGIVAAPEASYVIRAIIERIQDEPRAARTVIGIVTGSGVLDLASYVSCVGALA